MSREGFDLCGLWRFQPDLPGEGEQAAYFEPEYDDRRWREVRLPGTFETCNPDLDTYEGTCWFRRRTTVPADWQGKRVVLRFEGVNYHAKVWVNGRNVGEHHDGFLPFEFPVQDLIHFGGENVVVVRADNFRRKGEVPGLQRGWRTFGGILRQVEWSVTDPLCLDHVTVVAEPAAGGGRLAIRAWARNERRQGVEAALVVRVTDGAQRTLAHLTSRPLALQAGEEREFSVDGHVAGIKPWSPADPKLYTVQVELVPRLEDSRDGEPVDEQTVRVGFRTIQVRGGKLLLNGKPIFLTGFNRHEDSPRRDMATDLVTARRDLLDMKRAGANFVRLCHYPHHPGELDLCDELGLLAMDEIPLYWWDGYKEGEDNCRAKLAAAKRQLTAMIRRDVNHPSIVFWSVSNETDETRPEVVDGNRQLVCLAQELDPTRLAVHVSHRWQDHPHFDADDVICVNAYPSLHKRAYEGQFDYDLLESTGFWRERLRTLHERYPHKPILITEFGYAAFRCVYDNGFGEDLQAQAIEAEFAGMDAPYVCGATIWCWADHPWPQATFEFCQYLGTSPYGVVSRDRRRLGGYWAARRIFREKQGLVESPRPAAPKPGPAGHEVAMIRPNLLDVPQFPFPEGFTIRPMRMDEGGLWTDIERDAEDYFPITDTTFHTEFGNDLQAVQWRSFFIVNHKGVGVGTVSAWYDRSFKGQDYGRIHWIAVRPTYQRKGLGKAAMSFALNQLAQWHERAVLGTQTKRLPAIKLYLDFGFLPDLDSPWAVDVWREVSEQLQHPVLEKALTRKGDLE